MALTDTALNLWNAKLPVAALVASHAGHMAATKIDEPQRAVFDGALDALVAWWPDRRKRNLVDVWNEVHVEPVRLAGELKGNAKKAADVCVRALYLAVSNLERVGRGRRELPPDCYDVEPEHLEALLRDALKLHSATQVRDIDRRLSVIEGLLEGGKWEPIVAAAAAMGWTRLQPGLRKLAPRLRDLGEALDAGGAAESMDVGGRPALRVTMPGGERRIGVLDGEELASLRAVIPWIPA